MFISERMDDLELDYDIPEDNPNNEIIFEYNIEKGRRKPKIVKKQVKIAIKDLFGPLGK